MRIVLLGGDKESTRIVYHALKGRFPDVALVLEERGSRFGVLRRRIRRLGVWRVAGQALFAAVAVPFLRWRSRYRIREIISQNGLDPSAVGGLPTRVASVNSEECRSCLRHLKPDVVVVNGTRIIKPETLEAVDAPFINMHAGITPLYRGGHGAYWALAERRPDLVGTTIHVVDSGIDTGPILAQPKFRTTPADTFATYPYLHLAAGIPELIDVVAKALEGSISPLTGIPKLPSRLRYHPAIWEYLRYRFTAGVK